MSRYYADNSGREKRAGFSIIKEEDISILLSVGKEHFYIWEVNENFLHENDAAKILYDLCASENITHGEIKEGKIET